MARLFGAQRMVLQAIQDAQGDTSAFIEDIRNVQATRIALRDMKDWFLTLDQYAYVHLALPGGGMKARDTPGGGLALGLYRPFPTPSVTSQAEPARSRSGTGHERALVIGVSTYPSP